MIVEPPPIFLPNAQWTTLDPKLQRQCPFISTTITSKVLKWFDNMVFQHSLGNGRVEPEARQQNSARKTTRVPVTSDGDWKVA